MTNYQKSDSLIDAYQGRSDGDISGIYPSQNQSQVNFYGVKVMSERLLNMSI